MTTPIDYYGIETELQRILTNAASLDGLNVDVEPEFMLGAMDRSPVLSIYMIRRTQAVSEGIAAGTRQRYEIQMSLWLWLAGLEFDVLNKARSDWLWKIEAVLMANRTVNGKVTTLWLTGGDMAVEQQKERFMVGAETVLSVIVDASI